jgi:hypothetical protein
MPKTIEVEKVSEIQDFTVATLFLCDKMFAKPAQHG